MKKVFAVYWKILEAFSEKIEGPLPNKTAIKTCLAGCISRRERMQFQTFLFVIRLLLLLLNLPTSDAVFCQVSLFPSFLVAILRKKMLNFF